MADITIFDRHAVRAHRARATADFAAHDFLLREAAMRLAERLEDIRRRFALALELSSRGRVMAATQAVETWIASDLSAVALGAVAGPRVAADEEMLPFADGVFDLVAGALALHWINDLPGALIQLNRALKPDGLLLVSMIGGTTLAELRAALFDAELAVSGGARPRLSPFVDGRDAAALLQRAGFALPVVDSETIEVSYPDALALMRDLRGMGEMGALADRPRHMTRRATLLEAARLYQDRHGRDGRVPARFEIVTLTGWAPAANQPRPLRPGSAQTRLADALGAIERSAGERSRP